MEEICRDLRAEIEEFDAVLAKLDRKMRQIVTPFYGWTSEAGRSENSQAGGIESVIA